MALTDRERAILEFERSWWVEPGPKKEAIRRRLGLSSTRYYQLLDSLVTSQEALAHDPLVVRRLRRGRARRQVSRYDGRSSRPGR